MTNSEYAAFLARQQPENGGQRTEDRAKEEETLHAEILVECRRRGWIAFHGSMAHRTHRTIGEPDFVILADGGRVLLMEVKAPGKKLTPEQAALHAMAVKLGHRVAVVRTTEDWMLVMRGKLGPEERTGETNETNETNDRAGGGGGKLSDGAA